LLVLNDALWNVPKNGFGRERKDPLQQPLVFTRVPTFGNWRYVKNSISPLIHKIGAHP
jgi:hypothetical protein